MKLLKQLSRIFFYSVVAVIFLVLIIAGFTQTRAFRDVLRNMIVANITSTMNGSLSMGKIGGNFVTGFTIDSVAIVQNEDTVIAARKIRVRYELIPLLNRSLQVRDLYLDHPTFYFKRMPHGSWNFGSLFKPSTDTGSAGPAWDLDLRKLEIHRGEFRLLDSLSLAESNHHYLPEPSFEYHKFQLYDVNLILSAEMRQGRYAVHISQASCYSVHPELVLTTFSAEVSADTSRVGVKNLIVQTRDSYLELDAEMRHLNIFHGIDLKDLQHNPTTLRLRANNISFAELKQLLPPLEFLVGDASVQCDADGEFGDLTVRRLDVKTGRSSLTLSGRVRNLHTPDRLYLNVLLHDSRLAPSDANALMPSFSVPPFAHAGVADVRCEFAGMPTNFTAAVELHGPFGGIRCDASLNLSRRVPLYRAKFTTDRVILDSLFAIRGFHAIVSGSGEIAGEGFTIATLNDSLSLAVDSTEVQRLRIDGGTLTLRARARRLDIVASIEGRDMSLTFNGTGDFNDERKPSYHGELMLSNFDLSKIINDESQKSRLTLRTNFAGEGKTIDDVNGKITLSLLSSMYQGRVVQPQELSLSLNQHDVRQKRLSLESSFADAELRGRFDLDVLAATLVNQSMHFIAAVQEHATPPDSTGARKPVEEIVLPQHEESQRSFDFSYKITVNNLDPVSAVTGGGVYNARGSVEGTVTGTDRLLSLTARGNVDEFYMGSLAKGIFLSGSRISLSAKNLSPNRMLEQLTMQCSLSVGSALINQVLCDKFAFTLQYNNLVGRFAMGGEVDSFYQFRTAGQASIQPHTYALDFDTLELAMQGYRWINDQDVQIRLNYDGARVLHAEFKRNDERISLTGNLDHTGALGLTGQVRSFNLTGLGSILRNKDLLRPQRGFFGRCDADLVVSGSTAAPVFSLTVGAKDVYYRQSPIGAISASVDYADSLARLNVTVKAHAGDATPTLLMKGTLPIILSFKDVEERFPDTEQRLQVVSDGFDVSILDPLLLDFDNLTGKLRCNIDLLGTPRRPSYNGSITLTDVRFAFGPNNITYIANGVFEASEDKLIIKNLTASNPPTEPRQSDARFAGSITIRNFQVESFDVTAYGKLLLMTEASRKAIKSFYGPLFAETESDGINLRGTLQEPYLSGKLYVISADLVFPPTRSASTANPNQILNYVLVDDTTREQLPGDAFSSKFYRGYDAPLAARSSSLQSQYEPSFVDRLRYHLDVETRGTTAVRMIFTPSTNEELYAEIEGKVTAINNSGSATIYNEISVTSRSYYNFFKRFDAKGKLNFVGPWDNPELNINATYQGYRQSTAQPTNALAGPVIGPTLGLDARPEQKVIVELHITGTRYEPKLSMGMKVQVDPSKDPEDWANYAKGGDIQSDAISFILTGKFRDDLTSSERDNLASNFGSAGVTGFTSNLLSGIFTDFLRKEFPFIRNAEISYNGGNIGSSADVRVTGTAASGYFRVGGRILNDLGNANVSYQTSVGDFFNSTSIRNLFIELERRVEGDYTEDRRVTNNARLYYRFSF